MTRTTRNFPFAHAELSIIKQKMLSWASRFGIFLFLDSNEYTAQGGQYECLAGAGVMDSMSPDGEDIFEQLQRFHAAQGDWLFGHIAYDAKNLLEPALRSAHPSPHAFPLLRFFVPRVVMGILTGASELFIASVDESPDAIYQALMDEWLDVSDLPKVQFQLRMQHEAYLRSVDALRRHIYHGDCYEINFCNEGFCADTAIDPIAAFHKLNALSPAPFAACYRLEDQYLMCASPERYLRKAGPQLIAQPIKGTARRGADHALDEQLKAALYQSEKERAENVMIVDLMRNDLARSCETGSIRVDELFGIYTFPQVHQMISTISGRLRTNASFADALKYSFPMGSMTGAPKVKVMALIEQYEAARRGLFSGTVGYITPQGDFDFNVVIRSLFYNASSGYLSYQTGGAITWDSDPQSEWEELRLKAGAMERIFR